MPQSLWRSSIDTGTHTVEQLTRTLSQTIRHNQLAGEIEQLQAEIDRRSSRLETLRREQVEEPGPSRYRDALNRLLESTRRIEECEADIERLKTQRHGLQASVEEEEAALQDAVQSIEAVRRELSTLADQEKEASQRELQSTSAYSTLRRFVQIRDKLLHNRSTRENLQFQLDQSRQQLKEFANLEPSEQQYAAVRDAACTAAENVARRETLV